MENRGEEFVKNIKAKQEKEELEQRINELNRIDTSEKRIEESSNEDEIVDLPAQELGDILLSEKQNPADKKKYIILGLSLVALFILTIVIIRVISSPSTEKEIVEKETVVESNIPQDKVDKDMTDIEKQYQDIINQKLKNLRENAKDEEIESNNNASLDIKEIEKKEQEIVKPKQNITKVEEKSKQDIFEMEDTKEKAQKVTVKKETKPVVKPKPKKVVTSSKKTSTTKPRGYFIQVGAFSKKPNEKLLNKITQNGFKYVLYDVVIKGKKYTKLLVGSYSSKSGASKDLKYVRSVLKTPGAYIIHLK